MSAPATPEGAFESQRGLYGDPHPKEDASGAILIIGAGVIDEVATISEAIAGNINLLQASVYAGLGLVAIKAGLNLLRRTPEYYETHK